MRASTVWLGWLESPSTKLRSGPNCASIGLAQEALVGVKHSSTLLLLAQARIVAVLFAERLSKIMALAGALCVMVHAVAGFTNKSLRSLVAGLLGADYTSAQMTYDLRRLRLHGLITRLPGTHTYVTTPDGLRVAAFYTKLGARVLAPLLAADRPPAPIEVRCALATLDRAVNDYVTNARLGTAA